MPPSFNSTSFILMSPCAAMTSTLIPGPRCLHLRYPGLRSVIRGQWHVDHHFKLLPPSQNAFLTLLGSSSPLLRLEPFDQDLDSDLPKVRKLVYTSITTRGTHFPVIPPITLRADFRNGYKWDHESIRTSLWRRSSSICKSFVAIA